MKKFTITIEVDRDDYVALEGFACQAGQPVERFAERIIQDGVRARELRDRPKGKQRKPAKRS